jgi:hypothetical protein
METSSRGQLGQTLFRVWLAASALYLAVILVVSVTPIKAAVHLARQPYVAPAAIPTTGPDDRPESPTERAAVIVGRQILIGLAPPLLILWFAWDLGFAVAGFLESRSTRLAGEDQIVD